MRDERNSGVKPGDREPLMGRRGRGRVRQPGNPGKAHNSLENTGNSLRGCTLAGVAGAPIAVGPAGSDGCPT